MIELFINITPSFILLLKGHFLMILGLHALVRAQRSHSTWHFSRNYLETAILSDSDVSLLFVSIFIFNFIHISIMITDHCKYSCTYLMLELLCILYLFPVLRLSVRTWGYFCPVFVRPRTPHIRGTGALQEISSADFCNYLYLPFLAYLFYMFYLYVLINFC